MQRIALFGGSFDPPHLGHTAAINAILNSGLVDEVWLVPAGRNAAKPLYASAEQRKIMVTGMLNSVFANEPRISIKGYQLNTPEVATTVDLFERLEEKHPDKEFFFVIGSDLVGDIPGWQRADELMRRSFLVVPRLGHNLPGDNLPAYATLLPPENMVMTDISSSRVRELKRRGMSIAGVVPQSVADFIDNCGLYGSSSRKPDSADAKTLYSGNFINLYSKNGWEFVKRSNCTGILFVYAVNDRQQLVLVEQYRIPVEKYVIELPAGLVGDVDEAESMDQAARRELLEETGYSAAKMVQIFEGPISAGLTANIGTLFRATGLTKESRGGGDSTESIVVHEVALAELDEWLAEQQAAGKLIDHKIHTARQLA